MTPPQILALPLTISPTLTERSAIITQVCRVAEPDRIYLLGTVEGKRSLTNIFTTSAPSCHYTAHYLLLILESTTLATHEVGERIESGCKPTVPVTAITLKTAEFGNWLASGHPFAGTVITRAEQRYSNNAVSLPAFIPQSPDAVQQLRRTTCNTNSKRVASFLAAADLFRIRTEYGMSTFMLHQATECLLRTALHLTTGYYCNTHSLDKLYRLTAFTLWRLPNIFERHKPSGEALFSLLQRAYVETRYKDGYKISGTDLQSLFTKIEQLSNHLNEVINSLADVR